MGRRSSERRSRSRHRRRSTSDSQSVSSSSDTGRSKERTTERHRIKSKRKISSGDKRHTSKSSSDRSRSYNTHKSKKQYPMKSRRSRTVVSNKESSPKSDYRKKRRASSSSRSSSVISQRKSISRRHFNGNRSARSERGSTRRCSQRNDKYSQRRREPRPSRRSMTPPRRMNARVRDEPEDFHSKRSNRHSPKSINSPQNDDTHERDAHRQSYGKMNNRQRWRNKDRRQRSPIKWGKQEAESEEEGVEKEKPNYEVTGALAADTNTFKGVVIKYSEPPEARKPKIHWSLFPFKGEQPLPVYHIHRQSAYLFGRDRHIADIPVDHPSCSKQHAVFQYRAIRAETEDGRTVRYVKPYIIDLNSSNGTYLNDQRIEPQRYYEMFEKDVLRFGYSTREYVLLNEKSAENDGVKKEEEDIIEVKQELQE